MTYDILLPQFPALFVTSLIQIAEHKKAALTIGFSRLSNISLITPLLP